MGEVIRRYWIPAALSSELPEVDCPPVRVRLLGEKLVAFRDTRGHVGLVDEFCAHRCASLFLGRNGECGLRCVYHGWKYDVEGNCVDMPNEPPESSFKDKIHLKAYPTVELGDVIWAYMGPREQIPALPKFEWTQVRKSHRHVSKSWQECNWLQALEGSIDTVHAVFLHRALTATTTRAGTRGYVAAAVPKEQVDLTDYGLTIWSNSSRGDGMIFVRAFQYVMPFHSLFPFELQRSGEGKRPLINGHIFVPMGDEDTMVYNLHYAVDSEPPMDKDWKEWIERRRGRGPGEQTPGFRKVRCRDNDWLIDRQVQSTETYTGIEGINIQDHAVQESMGPIVDRSQERLGSNDRAVVAARLLLLRALKTVSGGDDPPGLAPTYYGVRAIEKVLSEDVEWRSALRHQIYGASD